MEREESHRNWKLVPYLLYKDELFEQAVLNPKPLALISYQLMRYVRMRMYPWETS